MLEATAADCRTMLPHEAKKVAKGRPTITFKSAARRHPVEHLGRTVIGVALSRRIDPGQARDEYCDEQGSGNLLDHA